MLRAFLLILACSTSGEPPPEVGAERLVNSGSAIRNCLRVASGLHVQGDRSAASDHVLSCYDQHFAPLEPALRDHNRRATLSLEYGFGVVAHAMTRRRGDPGAAAVVLADRVESVLETLPKSPTIAPVEQGVTSP